MSEFVYVYEVLTVGILLCLHCKHSPIAADGTSHTHSDVLCSFAADAFYEVFDLVQTLGGDIGFGGVVDCFPAPRVQAESESGST